MALCPHCNKAIAIVAAVEVAATPAKPLATTKQTPTPAIAIATRAAEVFGMTLAQLLSTSRQQTTMLARQMAMYAIRTKLRMSYPEISEIFGHRDHASSMNAVTKIARLLRAGDALATERVAAILSEAPAEPAAESGEVRCG